MKKVLSLILAGLMTISCAAFVAADDAAAEVAADPYQEYAIEFLESYGIYKGGEGITDEDDIQRYQMALFVARISTGWIDDYVWDYNYEWEDGPKNDSKFDDLAGTAAEHYYGAISYAQQKGIIEGYSATKFGPTDQITYRDALTMVVRTLGYTGLSYPWGYIEEAVELGLTENIDAAYTDPLTRGEVAVIIYNAMFAPTATGKTLAKEFFGVDYGWKNIVIVATDEGIYKAAASEKAAAGFVGFKVLEADGTLSASTYYVPSKDLALEGHEEEIELGAIYIALFTIDGDLVNMVDADTLQFATVINNGITDDKGEAVTTQPIADVLSAYKAAGYGKNYLSYIDNALNLWVEGGVYTWTSKSDKLVGIDYETNNIMFRTTEDGEWQIAWLYNSTLDKYYMYDYDAVQDKVYINWMSEPEFVEWYEKACLIAHEEADQYKLATDWTNYKVAPYARMKLFNTDADELAEYALYKDYELGYFSNVTLKCSAGNVGGIDHRNATDVPGYSIVAVDDTVSIETVSVISEVAHGVHDNGVHDAFGWFNVADGVVGFDNGDGSYNNGYVLYDYNKSTGEIEVVKYIAKAEGATGTDADSYWFTGLLQAYSTSGAYITVDGDRYYFGYDKLDGATLKVGDGSLTYRRPNAEELDAYLMQYVEVLVVDGKVVDVDLHNASADYIVVLDYAGVTSDGYIAVYGYSTVDANLDIFKINSYNGWKKGDYRYNPANADTDKAFDCGTVYAIKSFDAATNSYGVYTYEIDELTSLGDFNISFELGYRVLNNATAKNAAGHTYIIITDDAIYATTGDKVNSGFSVTGGKIIAKSGERYVVYADSKAVVKGFDGNAHNVGFVLYDEDYAVVLEAGYDAEQQFENFYLLGSTYSMVNVFNLLTGKNDFTFWSNNIDLEDGNVYMTVNGAIVTCVYDASEDKADADATIEGNLEFLEFIDDYYNLYDEPELANYLVVPNANKTEAKAYTIDKNGLKNTTILGDLDLLPTTANADIIAEYAKALLPQENIKYFFYEGKNGLLDVSDNAETLGDAAYVGYVLYNNVDDLAVVYIDASKTVTTEKTASDKLADVTLNTWKYDDVTNKDEAELNASVDGYYNYTKDAAGTVTKNSAVIEKVSLSFDMLIKEDCADRGANGYAFGFANDHFSSFFGSENSYVTYTFYNINDGKQNSYTVEDMVFAGDACADCDMVTGVTIDIDDVTLLPTEQVWFYVSIDGKALGLDDSDTLADGNDVEVIVKAFFRDGAVELEYTDLVINGVSDNYDEALNVLPVIVSEKLEG